MLRLHYGNDKRNPIRSLDIAESLPAGSIFLKAGGFSPGAGELNELWSGNSIRFDGQQKLAESRQNSELAITYVLQKSSQAALSYLNRKITSFFLEARQHQIRKQGHTVWLEYRWSDMLNSLPTPTFGQLSTYYEILSARVPRWPDNLHDELNSLGQGVIEGIQMQLTASPAPEGLKQKAARAAGTITLQSNGVQIASGASSQLHWTSYTNSGLTANFTITGWITLSAAPSGNMSIFDYYVNASNRIRIVYNTTSTRWEITKIVGGTTYSANSSSDTIASGDNVHLALVQDDTTLALLVNGVQVASVSAANSMTDGGTIALGCPGTGSIDGVNVILDGWRIMPDDISDAYIATLYEAELPIKQDGGAVGPPPYFWTKDGDNRLDNCDDTTRDNWGIIGGVGGDLPARTEIQVMPAAGSYTLYKFWLGLKTSDAILSPTGNNIFVEFDGAADSTCSGTGYQEISATAADYATSVFDVELEQIFGRYHAIGRLYLSGAVTTTVTLKYTFGGDYINGKATQLTPDGLFILRDLGDIMIYHPGQKLKDANITFSVFLSLRAASSVTSRIDFILLLPEPFVRIDVTSSFYASGAPLVIDNGMAYGYDSGLSTVGLIESLPYYGHKIEAIPNKYNYLFILAATAANVWGHNSQVLFDVFVTPRYSLPGGMVA